METLTYLNVSYGKTFNLITKINLEQAAGLNQVCGCRLKVDYMSNYYRCNYN